MSIRRRFSQYVRWYNMVAGKSVMHSPQSSNYSSEIFNEKLYPNNLASKLNWNGYEDLNGIPRNLMSDGNLFYFPISIVQKGLAHHDHYIKTKSQKDFQIFSSIVNFFVETQDENGGWDCWSQSDKNTITSYSSMAQGQVLSLLTRYIKLVKPEKSLTDTCHKAYNLLHNEPLSKHLKNGALLYNETPINGGGVIFNGHIFSLWGVMDYEAHFGIEKGFSFKGLKGVEVLLSQIDRGYWSNYDNVGNIASPFYHDLHISQLQALYYQTGNDVMLRYMDKFSQYTKVFWYKKIAFFLKAWQKIKEKSYNEFVS